jgi:uncharacterized protein (TIGR02145 family)
MRKTTVSLSLIALASAFVVTSCVNSIKQEEEEGKVPIRFSTQIVPNLPRIMDEQFEVGEEIGLFATTPSNTLADRRYIDNLELTCNKAGVLTSTDVVYYPEGDEALNFVAYYPYQLGGVTPGTSTLAVSVSTDQSQAENHSLSDFLVAELSGVHSSSDPVQLTFQHKLSKLKMVLLPHDKGGAKDLQAANPKLTLSAIKTLAEYDLQQETFANFSEAENIRPYGTWRVDGDSVIGEEFILIPQTLTAADNSFTLEWNGRFYNCPMPNIETAGGTQYEIRILMDDAEPPILSGIIGKIENWKDGKPNDVVDGKNGVASIHLASLSFDKSDIYRIYDGAYTVAEVCKEYLSSDKIKSRAIVAYPMKSSGSADLSQGLVLQFLDATKLKVGGLLEWNTTKNTFAYTEGNKERITDFYIDSSDKPVVDKPASPVKVSVVSYLSRDAHNTQARSYPIVKIGTQYWLKENFCATTYSNGESIAQQTTLDGTPGYFHENGSNDYFYNGEVLRPDLAYADWRIPSTNDWKALCNYVGNKTELLTAGEWQPNDTTTTTVSRDDATGFNALAVGQWYKGKQKYQNKMTVYWALDGTAVPAEIPHLTCGSDTIMFSTSTSSTSSASRKSFYKGVSVRLMKSGN